MRWTGMIFGFILSFVWILCIPNIPFSDPAVYHTLAERITVGQGFVNDSGQATATWTPGYPFYLSFFYSIFGVSMKSAFFANFLCYIALVTGVYQLASMMYTKRAGILAGTMTALYPSFIFFNTILAGELLYSSLVVWAMVCGWHSFQSSKGKWVIFCGILLGLSCFVRPQSLIFPLTFFMLGAAKGFSLPSSLKKTVFISCIMLLTCLPWTVRNYANFHEFILISSNSGINLWIGNHDGATGKYVDVRDKDIVGLSIEKADKLLGEKAIKWIKAHPERFFLLMFKKTYITLRNESIAAVWNKIGIESKFGEETIFYFKLVTNMSYFLAMCVTFFCILKSIKSGHFGKSELFLFSLIALMLVPTLIFHGDDRFHLPMMPYLFIFISGCLTGKSFHP